MNIDLDLYRHEVRVSTNPLVRLSAIDISPDRPQRTFVFLHGFGGQANQWTHQLQEFSLENRVIALDLRGHGLSDKPTSGYDMPPYPGRSGDCAGDPQGQREIRAGRPFLWGRNRHRIRPQAPRTCRGTYPDCHRR